MGLRSPLRVIALLCDVASTALVGAGAGRAETKVTDYPGGRWEPGPAVYGVSEVESFMVPMDDGVRIAAKVSWPTDPASGKKATGPFPVLMTQTPYAGGA